MGVTSYLTRIITLDSETFETIDKVIFNAAIPLRIGYRYQKPEGGFFFAWDILQLSIFQQAEEKNGLKIQDLQD